MKPSKYNYFVNNGEMTIVFNGVTERFFEIKTENLTYYKEIINRPQIFKKDYKAFVDKLRAEGFIYDENEVEEITNIQNKFKKLQQPDQYLLMILPTYQCNLRCWYCVQNHQNLWLSDEVTARIKNHIRLKLEDSTIKSFVLSWFGGEPLMAYNKLVEITRFAKNITKKYKKVFSVMITTNGTLLTPERIEELRELGVSKYQITIDGKQELHDKVKHLSGKSSYDITLNNINLITKHTSCCIRFNYTKNNLEPHLLISDLKNKISEECKKNIRFLIYKVWQEDEKSIDPNKVNDLFELSENLGIHPQLPRSGMCYADQKHFNCIFPDGSIEKCDNEDPSSAKGMLMPDGRIVWNHGIPKSHKKPFDIKDSECYMCNYLPICWGPCVTKRDFMIKKYGNIKCEHEDKDEYINNIIRNIVKTFKSKAQLI